MKKLTLMILAVLFSAAMFGQTYKLGDDVKNTSGVTYGHVIYIDQSGVYVACKEQSPERLMWADRWGSFTPALTYCKTLNYGGYSDWTLPSPAILISMKIMMLSNYNLMLWYNNRDGQPYWTSFSNTYTAYAAFTYKLGAGMFSKEMLFNVLPVRKIVQ